MFYFLFYVQSRELPKRTVAGVARKKSSLTFNNYFYRFLYLFITRITINNNTPHLKSVKEPKQNSRLGTASIEIIGGLQLVKIVFNRPSGFRGEYV